MTNAITLHGLSKRYGARAAVENLTIDVPPGVVAGFVGPNGAGKTTTMAMLLGLVKPSGGSGRVLGKPLETPSSYLGRVGALVEGPAFYPALTGAQNLAVLATAAGHDRSQIPGLLDLVGLAARGDDRFRDYSFGMKQRLGIAAALLGNPSLLLLDEPINGLDAGRLVFEGPAAELLDRGGANLAVAPEHPGDLERLRGLLTAAGHDSRAVDDHLEIAVDGDDPRGLAAALNRTAGEGGIVLAELRVTGASLEDRYLTIVKNGGDR